MSLPICELFPQWDVQIINMDNDPRIVELLTDMAKGIDQLVVAQATTNTRLEHIENRLENVEQQQKKTNVILQSHTLSLVKIAEVIQNYPEVLSRLAKLESAVFH
jgi:hypothetical protein